MYKALKAIGINGSNGYEQWSSREQEVIGNILKEEYELYCKENPDFYREKGNLEIIHPVADKLKEGGFEKEEYISKQERIDEIGNEAYKKFNGAIQQDNIKLQHTKRQLNADVALKQSELAQIQTDINHLKNDKNELQRQLQPYSW